MPPQHQLDHSQEHQGSQNASKYLWRPLPAGHLDGNAGAGGCSVSVVAMTSINNPTAKAIIRA